MPSTTIELSSQDETRIAERVTQLQAEFTELEAVLSAAASLLSLCQSYHPRLGFFLERQQTLMKLKELGFGHFFS